MNKSKQKFLKNEPAIRIIGGRYGGRKLKYVGDPGTRPMKDRTREAVFNLIGTELKGKHVIDLFAGTGAMAFEALSRGAESATLIERNFPMARSIRENAELLEVQDRIELVTGDVFAWAQRGPQLNESVRVVFCCPPYALFAERPDDVLQLLQGVQQEAAPGSLLVIEFDDRFSRDQLAATESWDFRSYAPAIIGIRRL